MNPVYILYIIPVTGIAVGIASIVVGFGYMKQGGNGLRTSFDYAQKMSTQSRYLLANASRSVGLTGAFLAGFGIMVITFSVMLAFLMPAILDKAFLN